MISACVVDVVVDVDVSVVVEVDDSVVVEVDDSVVVEVEEDSVVLVDESCFVVDVVVLLYFGSFCPSAFRWQRVQ